MDNKKRSKSNIYYLFTALNESSDIKINDYERNFDINFFLSVPRSLNVDHMSSTRNNIEVWLVVSAFCLKKSLRVLDHKGRSC